MNLALLRPAQLQQPGAEVTRAKSAEQKHHVTTGILPVMLGDSSVPACPPTCHLSAIITVWTTSMSPGLCLSSPCLPCPPAYCGLHNPLNVHLSLLRTLCYWLRSCSKTYEPNKTTMHSDPAIDSCYFTPGHSFLRPFNIIIYTLGHLIEVTNPALSV